MKFVVTHLHDAFDGLLSNREQTTRLSWRSGLEGGKQIKIEARWRS